PNAYFQTAVGIATVELFHRKRPAAALRIADDAVRQHPLAAIPAEDRPYLGLAWFYGHAGRPDRGQQLIAEFERALPEAVTRGQLDKARDYYGRFVELWKDADGELQPAVRDVRARIVRLSRETGNEKRER